MSKREERTTLSGRLPEQLDDGAPAPIDPETGMHRDYWILSQAERAKGFVRPVRTSYMHVGPPGPQNATRRLTSEEAARYAGYGYDCYEEYPPGDRAVGRFWTKAGLDAYQAGGCRTVTRMVRELAETYARDPKFYGATFCCRCGKHLPVNEFFWLDTQERVGS